MDSYISLNVQYSAEVKNDFENNQYKFLNCSMFGKTIQNNRKQGDIRLVTNERTRNRVAFSVIFEGSNYILDFL